MLFQMETGNWSDVGDFVLYSIDPNVLARVIVKVNFLLQRKRY